MPPLQRKMETARLRIVHRVPIQPIPATRRNPAAKRRRASANSCLGSRVPAVGSIERALWRALSISGRLPSSRIAYLNALRYRDSALLRHSAYFHGLLRAVTSSIMPRWVVTCPNCGHTFTHTQIEARVVEEYYRDPFKILPRPSIPQESEHRTCPNCQTESVFRPFQLFYREDTFDASA